MVKCLPAMRETPLRFLGQEDPLDMAYRQVRLKLSVSNYVFFFNCYKLLINNNLFLSHPRAFLFLNESIR